MNNIHFTDHKKIKAKITSIFKKSNLRMTKTRWHIVDVFLDGCHSHTINEIKEHLQKMGLNFTLASIYNAVSVFLDLGILLAYFNRSEQKACFELNVIDEKIHTHFFDLDTKKYRYVENSKEINQFLCDKCKENGYNLEFGIIAINVRENNKSNNNCKNCGEEIIKTEE